MEDWEGKLGVMGAGGGLSSPLGSPDPDGAPVPWRDACFVGTNALTDASNARNEHFALRRQSSGWDQSTYR